MAILVMGATGAIGRVLVERLLESGQEVKALTRDATKDTGLPAGTQICEGDFRRPDSLAGAIQGVDRVYLLADPGAVHGLVPYLRKAGVRRIVTVASAMLDERDDNGVVHNVIEDAVKGSGAEWTILRPRAFASNALNWWRPTIRLHRGVHWVYPEARLSPIHEADVAAVAAVTLAEEGHAGRTYTLTGPESLTQAEQVRQIGEAIGATIFYDEISREKAKEVLTSQYIPEQIVTKLLDMLESMVGTAAPVTTTVEELTGKPARTFAQWAVDHADDFR
ncbi:NAD(P)H-binding protein [Nonomuraea aridisoli]|uniref:NAD-dependent epimerase n=1 Tax=Nonomuraea aridisoli TaxID=2070368 RepID=A0A2W2E857_9ACTN|nr:NAD(P)H-binding protein [Nonomuraea aridisoli]PZG18733.1 NAD-dependent epimerase [Nonomuraea aridisoli]